MSDEKALQGKLTELLEIERFPVPDAFAARASI